MAEAMIREYAIKQSQCYFTSFRLLLHSLHLPSTFIRTIALSSRLAAYDYLDPPLSLIVPFVSSPLLTTVLYCTYFTSVTSVSASFVCLSFSRHPLHTVSILQKYLLSGLVPCIHSSASLPFSIHTTHVPPHTRTYSAIFSGKAYNHLTWFT